MKNYYSAVYNSLLFISLSVWFGQSRCALNYFHTNVLLLKGGMSPTSARVTKMRSKKNYFSYFIFGYTNIFKNEYKNKTYRLPAEKSLLSFSIFHQFLEATDSSRMFRYIICIFRSQPV